MICAAPPFLAAPATASAPLHCPLPAGGYQLGDGLPRAAEKLKNGGKLTVVAIGSSSTQGVGASGPTAAYPAWLGRALLHTFPDSEIAVFNRGISGQTAAEMSARFDRDVSALRPDIVLWQTGTIEAVDHLNIAAFADTVRSGLRSLRSRGIEVMLVNQQNSPRLEAAHPGYRRYVDIMRRIAREENVAMLDRYESMRRWGAVAQGGLMTLMSADDLHMKDDSYRCFGAAAAAVLACAAGRECPEF
jgi:acyl-CoA thioesterase I